VEIFEEIDFWVKKSLLYFKPFLMTFRSVVNTNLEKLSREKSFSTG